jgi:hypothetical protein
MRLTCVNRPLRVAQKQTALFPSKWLRKQRLARWSSPALRPLAESSTVVLALSSQGTGQPKLPCTHLFYFRAHAQRRYTFHTAWNYQATLLGFQTTAPPPLPAWCRTVRLPATKEATSLSPVPNSWFLTTLTASRLQALSVCCTRLTDMGFTAFPGDSLRHSLAALHPSKLSPPTKLVHVTMYDAPMPLRLARETPTSRRCRVEIR